VLGQLTSRLAVDAAACHGHGMKPPTRAPRDLPLIFRARC
jgi:hypothetical protein